MSQKPDPRALVAYWNQLYNSVLKHPKRRAALETLTETDKSVFTTTSLATRVEDRLREDDLLDDGEEYGRNKLNSVLPHLETSGVITRIPKAERDDQYISFVNYWIRDWLSNQDLEKNSPTTLPEEEDEGSACMVYYIGNALASESGSQYTEDAEEDSESEPTGNTLPIEATLYTAVQQHATVEDPTFAIALGSLDEIRDTKFMELLEALDLNVELPEPDDPYDDQRQVHDYSISGLVGEVRNVHEPEDLKKRIEIQLATWSAGAFGMYSASRSDGGTKGTLEGAQVAALSEELLDKDGLSAALKRFGFGVKAANDRVIFGSYVRQKLSTQK
ncbi:hypothetical protein [Haloferax marisrubri]|uniref:hypothetical protein n=1 Tax=Haloferax marisrubri TaxID=1544719 RepID=UPI000A92B040|nr:hypothetical protein [Haloferax marisrubri]